MSFTEQPINSRSYRLDSIDMLRGLVIVIMALDHVRDYFMAGTAQDPMTDPNVGTALFFTRWITHFCAPVFVFLAGTSAGLMQQRKSASELGGFLFKRGLWLVFIEIVVISAAWTFAPGGITQLGGQTIIILQVIWAIGASMMVLAAAQFLGRRSCLILGALILLGHNALDANWPQPTLFEDTVGVWVALHAQATYQMGSFTVYNGYPLLPWIGVMLVGFGSASIFEQDPERRQRTLLWGGAGLSLAFIGLRAMDIYGDANHWATQGDNLRTLLDFLNTTKYPPSLLYLLMTLGPAAMLCAVADRTPASAHRVLVNFGRAPFAFYIAHLYLIHAACVALGMYQGFSPNQMMTIMGFFPEGYGLSLAGVYVVWALVVAALYPLARSVTALKARRKDWWLSYL